jgi:hypothetical protein
MEEMDDAIGMNVLEKGLVESVQAHTDKSELANSKSPLYDVCEVFSPPRTAQRARMRNLRGGWSLDVEHKCPVTGRRWDLLDSGGTASSKEPTVQDTAKAVDCVTAMHMFFDLAPDEQEKRPEEDERSDIHGGVCC